MSLTKHKLSELFMFQLFFVLAGATAVLLQLDFVATAILYMGLPCIYLTFSLKKFSKKMALEAFIVTIPVVTVVDYVMHVSGSWWVSSPTGIRILGTFPLEEFLWGFLYVYFMSAFYEHFFDRHKQIAIDKRLHKLILIFATILVLFFTYLIFKPNGLHINYFYAILISLFIAVNVYGFVRYPHLLKPILTMVLYGAIPSAIYEFVALYLGQWSFPIGQHLAYISLLGLTVPVEEVLWFFLAPSTLLLIYEAFADNRR